MASSSSVLVEMNEPFERYFSHATDDDVMLFD